MSDSPFGIKHKRGDCYATWYASKKASELVGHFGFTEFDEEDISQTLLLKLLERWPKFDPDHALPGQFVSWAIKKGVADIIRDQQQQIEFEPTVSIPPDDADDEFGDLPDCSVPDPSHLSALQMDVKSVLERLPPELREVGELLQEHSAAEVEVLTGKSRSAIRHAMSRIRQAFVDEGFEHASPG